MTAGAGVRLTIGELAEAAGMTVRNIRNHQSRGLLPPPEVVARTGYYGAAHVDRLRRIRAMQADGYNLEAIRRLLSGSGLQRAATLPAEVPELPTAAELEARFGRRGGEALVAAVRAGCEGIARAFVEQLWSPGLGEAEAAEAVEALRPVAGQTVLAVLDQAMTAEAGRALSGAARTG
jgi:DNA-binding transcriptional MerR regulator